MDSHVSPYLCFTGKCTKNEWLGNPTGFRTEPASNFLYSLYRMGFNCQEQGSPFSDVKVHWSCQRTHRTMHLPNLLQASHASEMWPGSWEHTRAAAMLFTYQWQCYASRRLPSKNISIKQSPSKLSNHAWYWGISNQINSTFSPQIGNIRTLTSKNMVILNF